MTRTQRLTPPQQQALRYLREGWLCRTGGLQPSRFGNLVWYSFARNAQTVYVAGSTLASLQRRGWIAWDAATLVFAYDQSTYPGWVLVLTETAPAG